MATTGTRYGSDLIVDLLNLYGIEYASLNPGSSFRGLHDSIVNYGGNRPEIIECPHEKVAVLMAHGYARASGKPMAAILHNLVGLLHGTMGIYYAYNDEAPVLVLGASGPMDTSRRRPGIDWRHTAQVQGNVVRDYTKWDDQPYSVDSVPESFARAYRVAMTPPQGPVYLCYDVSLQEDPLDHEVPLLDPKRVAPPPPLGPDPQTLEQVAQMLLQAQRPVVLADGMGRNPQAVAQLVELAELLALPVIDLGKRFNFPNTHPLDLTGSDVLLEADLVLALDVKDLQSPLTRLDRATRRTQSILPEGCQVVDISLRDLNIKAWSQGFEKLPEADVFLAADSCLTLSQLNEVCRDLLAKRGRDGLEERSQRLWAARESVRHRWQEDSKVGWDSKPVTTARLAWEIWQVIQGEDWVLTGSNLAGWTRRLWDLTKPDQYPGAALGTATQISLSLGTALAHKGSGKLVVAIQPDGDLMFDTSALWIASYYKIPMLVVMYNNRAYYNDWEHQVVIARERGRAEENAFVGMEINNPAPDFARLAQSFDWHAEGPIEDPAQIRPALERALRVIKETGKPALVDVITQFR